MRTLRLFLFAAALLIGGSSPLRAQSKSSTPEPCSLINAGQLNQLFGTQLGAGQPNPRFQYCAWQSADQQQLVTLQISATAPGVAARFVQSAHENAARELQASGRHMNTYTELHPLPKVGGQAYWVAGTGTPETPAPVVRGQFTIGDFLITLDTRGIAPEKVGPKLDAFSSRIRTAIKKQ